MDNNTKAIKTSSTIDKERYGMSNEELKFIDDELFVYTPIPQYGDGICKVQLVMTKEVFQECYDRWIKPQVQIVCNSCLEALSNSEKLNKWVPISKRLPEDDRDYLVTRSDIVGRPVVAKRYFSKDLFKVDEFDFVDKKGISGWCDCDSEYGWYIDNKVIAWRELPEPYKAEKSEKE